MSDYINRSKFVTNENLQLCPCHHPKCEQARLEENASVNNYSAYLDINDPKCEQARSEYIYNEVNNYSHLEINDPKCEQARSEYIYNKVNNYVSYLEVNNAAPHCKVNNTAIQWEDNNSYFNFSGKPTSVFPEHPYIPDFPLELYRPRNQKYMKTCFPRRNK